MSNTREINSEIKDIEQDVVLVVEDDTNSRLLLNAYLTSAGYSVKMARSGEEALDMVKKEPPNAIILDILLPNMNGYEICTKLKNSEVTNFIPIVLATALRGNDERIKGIEAGADDFISKPFNKVELITRIKSLLRIKRLHDEKEQKVKELEKAKAKLRKLAVTDGLTGIYNYRAFRRQLHLEISRSKRFHLPFSLLMMDIDHFKVYNDYFGHQNGDRVLQIFTRLISENIRDVDCVARYGGEEFVIIFPGTDKSSSKTVAEKLRQIIETSPFPLEKKLPIGKVTVSIGVATFPDDTEEEEEIIRLTDQALYKAKNNGRNRTEIN